MNGLLGLLGFKKRLGFKPKQVIPNHIPDCPDFLSDNINANPDGVRLRTVVSSDSKGTRVGFHCARQEICSNFDIWNCIMEVPEEEREP